MSPPLAGAAVGKTLAYNGTSWVVTNSGVVTTPGGSTSQVQYNSSGAFPVRRNGFR